MTATQTLLSNVVYGTPSGNYDGSSSDWISPAVQAADYYHGRGSVQTIAFDIEAVQALFTVEATLDTDPDSASWVSVYEFGQTLNPVTQLGAAGVQGNFTWLRVNVRDFSAGQINSVTVTY